MIALAIVLNLLFVIALCVAAKRGDEAMEQYFAAREAQRGNALAQTQKLTKEAA